MERGKKRDMNSQGAQELTEREREREREGFIRHDE